MELEELLDYPILKQLSESLWDVGNTRGAAIMVGAGFSRNAELLTPLTPKPPLWWDFQNAMKEKLPSVMSGSPLVLAEKYEGMYGRPELDGLIRRLIRDEEWEPSELHRRLLDLPWNDALTTNWDTLLERTRENLHSQRFYDVVNVPEDIARTRAPRIVKLHGSLPSYTPFIFTSGDYEAYPERRSSFVNLVQQVLLENDLCLIGFSGEDPNFKEWLGWVKKELGKNARRIFLLGNLGLTEEERDNLIADHIVPVDLAPLFEGNKAIDDPYQESSRVILEFLEKAKPKPLHDWPDGILYEEIIEDKVTESPDGGHASESFEALKDPLIAAARIREKLPLFRRLRESYPGWLVCPNRIRSQIRQAINSTFSGLDKSQELLDAEEVGRAIYEMAWAKNISYLPFDNCDQPLLEKAVEGEFSVGVTQQQRLYLAKILLRTAREDLHEGEIYHWRKWLEDRGDAEANAYVAFERCLQARDLLDYPALQQEAQKLVERDPIWKLRKAGFYADLGKIDESTKLIRQATFELENRRSKDRNSLWVISRLAWAGMLSRALRWNSNDDRTEEAKTLFETADWPDEFKESRSDPFSEMEALEEALGKYLRKLKEEKQPVRAKFDPGRYSDASKVIRFVSSNHELCIYQFSRMVDETAIPMVLGSVGIINTRIQNVLYFSQWGSVESCLSNIRILLDAKEKDWDEHLSRVSLASINREIIPEIVDKLGQSIDFFARNYDDQRSRTSGLTSRIDALIEIKSRFVGCLSATEAEVVFKKACEYLSNDFFQEWRLFRSIENLLRRSLLAMPPSLRGENIIDIVNLPFAVEKGHESEWQWPDFIHEVEIRSANLDVRDLSWKRRISEITKLVVHNSDSDGQHSTRDRAISLLFCVNKLGLLSVEQQQSFTAAVWEDKNSDRIFPASNLYAHSYLQMPCPASVDSRSLFNTYYNLSETKRPSPNQLHAIRGAALIKGQVYLPSLDQARLMLDLLIQLSPVLDEEKDRFGYDYDSELFQVIGGTVADAILPVFSKQEWSSDLTVLLKDWINREDIASALEVAPQLLLLDSEVAGFVESKIRRGLHKRDKSGVRAALRAIWRWVHIDDLGFPSLPSSLSKGVVGIVSTLRYPLLHEAISIAQLLVRKSLVASEDIEMLLYALEDLEGETNYATWDQNHAETCSLPFVRMNAVLLANALIDKGHDSGVCRRWISVAENDPLPEVRYALGETDA